MAQTDVPLFKRIAEEKLMKPYRGRQDHFMTGAEAVALVRKGMFALNMEESRAYKIMEDTYFEHEKCGLVNIEYLKFTAPFICIQRESPYKEIMRVK